MFSILKASILSGFASSPKIFVERFRGINPLKSIAFQDRLVMTASIRLRVFTSFVRKTAAVDLPCSRACPNNIYYTTFSDNCKHYRYVCEFSRNRLRHAAHFLLYAARHTPTKTNTIPHGKRTVASATILLAWHYLMIYCSPPSVGAPLSSITS